MAMNRLEIGGLAIEAPKLAGSRNRSAGSIRVTAQRGPIGQVARQITTFFEF